MRLPPGASFDSTSPDSAKSVMAVPTMGISVVAFRQAWAAGVPMARMRSTPSFAKVEAMVVQVDCSLLAFCWSAS